MRKLFFCIVFLWVSNASATTIVVKGVGKGAPVYSNPDNEDVPIISVAPGTRFEVLETQGEWYKVTVEFEEGFNVTGWIHNSSVTDAAVIEEQKSKSNVFPESPEWESYEKKETQKELIRKEGQETEHEKTNFWGSMLLRNKKSSAKQGEIQLHLGTQIKDYTLRNAPTSTNPNPTNIIDYGQPKALLTGLEGYFYFLNLSYVELGVSGEYTFSWYKYDVVINNNQTTDNLTSYLYTFSPNLSFRYIILDSRHFVSFALRLGFRYVRFQGDDATDNGQPIFFSVDNTIRGFNLGLINADYLFPPIARDFRFGFHASYDALIKPSYSESNVDSDGDGVADDVITGDNPTTPLINHIIAFSFLVRLYEHYSAEIGYQLSDFDIDFSGTGSRLNFTITDGQVNDNYYNIFLKVGYLF